MAGLDCYGNPGPIALAGGTAKTVAMVEAPANHRLRMKEWSVAFDGTSTTAQPVKVEVIRYSNNGTMTTLASVKADDGLPETPQATFRHSASAEPTVIEILDTRFVHPQSGYVHAFAYGEHDMVKGGGRLGLRCTAPAGVNVVPKLKWEE